MKTWLDQYDTPAWAPVSLWARYFSDAPLTAGVADPGCGKGRFMQAIPQEFRRVIGIEIDQERAALAHQLTGREVLVGDFTTIELPYQPDIIFGNPPFTREVAEAFLTRAARSLRPGGRCGYLLPDSFLSFSSTLDRWRSHFSIEKDSIPRDLFPRIRYPLAFYLFTTDGLRRLRGFVLFEESHAVNGTPARVKLALMEGGKRQSVWRVAITEAMQALGGRASLQQLYAYIAGRRPRLIDTWEATIRRNVQEFCVRVGPGEWALPDPIA